MVTLLGVLVDTFNFSLERYSKDIEISQLVDQQQLDYKTSLTGKIPVYEVKVPATLTKEKYYELQNRLTKCKSRLKQPSTCIRSDYSESYKSTLKSKSNRTPPYLKIWALLMPEMKICFVRRVWARITSLPLLFSMQPVCSSEPSLTSKGEYKPSSRATRRVLLGLCSPDEVCAAHPDQDHH